MQPLRLLQRLRDQGRHELDRDWEGGYCGENSKRQLDRCGRHLHHQTVDGVAFSPKIEEQNLCLKLNTCMEFNKTCNEIMNLTKNLFFFATTEYENVLIIWKLSLEGCL